MTQPTTTKNDPTRKPLNATIGEWYPEDPDFWQQQGQRIATRNLCHRVIERQRKAGTGRQCDRHHGSDKSDNIHAVSRK